MSILELFEFTLKFNLAAPDTATWIYMLLIAVFVILGLGLVWGKMWNREWSLGGHVASLVIVLLCSAGARTRTKNTETDLGSPSSVVDGSEIAPAI